MVHFWRIALHCCSVITVIFRYYTISVHDAANCDMIKCCKVSGKSQGISQCWRVVNLSVYVQWTTVYILKLHTEFSASLYSLFCQ